MTSPASEIEQEVRVAARVAEMALLFVVAPVLLALGPRWMVSIGILGSGILCLVLLLLDPTFARRQLAGLAEARRGLGPVLLRTSVIWALLLGVTLVFTPKTLFLFPRTRPHVWVAVMFLYPIFAYAQEIVCRTFFFHRYGMLFARRWTRIVVSGLVFGWAHVAVNNFVAVGLAAVAGVLFASTYERSRSTLLVSLEHALYGDFVFTVGLGSLFYSTARWVAH
ncbi:MAG TPA: CPBP family intramembrane glutamic endopeptidase [Polyangia bacterium]|nr:CPBP family intramembrane glutamic endopeptidase [Polyangia bacterium]